MQAVAAGQNRPRLALGLHLGRAFLQLRLLDCYAQSPQMLISGWPRCQGILPATGLTNGKDCTQCPAHFLSSAGTSGS